MVFISRRYALLAVAAASIAATGCGGGNQGQTGAPPPPEVAVHTVVTESAQMTVTLPGRTSAWRVAQVRPQVSGLIEERLFEEGDAVKAGQPLYKIDAAPYEAAYQSAAAALARAEALANAAKNRAERFAELVKTNAVSQQDYDDAVAAERQTRADIAAARAARDSAKIDLDRTTITAPIDGRIGRSFVTDGALVTANQTQELAVIHALDPIYVDVTQSSAEILRWKRKQEKGELQTADGEKLGVTLTLEDGSIYEEKGKLELSEVSVDPATGAVTLRAVFPNPDDLLLPGMFVRAQISEGVRNDAILVPQQAVARNPQGEGVAYVVDAEGKAEERIVATDRAMGDQWVIASGLKPGERIVVEGFQRFRPGDPVTPVEVSRVADAASPKNAAPETAGVR
ncbi:MAG: efflux RND transporter periplasmic adaptor subunit [Pseudomonadota bacterium]|nr:efflux RND transporter periplasmic adaptor subunit [Pseudomonadota bacterium]